MTQKPKGRFAEMTDAAEAFVAELDTYASLSESFQRAPLVTARHIERIKETLALLGASEERLAACGRAMAAAVSAAHQHQEKLARATLDKVPALQSRAAELAGLLAEFDKLGEEVAAANQIAAGFAHEPPSPEDRMGQARALADTLRVLGERAQQIAIKAREAEFEELANRGHALAQQLQSAHRKLGLATLVS